MLPVLCGYPDYGKLRLTDGLPLLCKCTYCPDGMAPCYDVIFTDVELCDGYTWAYGTALNGVLYRAYYCYGYWDDCDECYFRASLPDAVNTPSGPADLRIEVRFCTTGASNGFRVYAYLWHVPPGTLGGIFNSTCQATSDCVADVEGRSLNSIYVDCLSSHGKNGSVLVSPVL